MKNVLIKPIIFLSLSGVSTLINAGSIDGVFCQNSRFVVVASPDEGEECILISNLTINGESDNPTTSVVIEENTRIDLRKMAAGDVASVTFDLRCVTDNADTITEDNNEDSTSDCQSIAELRSQLNQAGLSQQQRQDITNLINSKSGGGQTGFTSPRRNTRGGGRGSRTTPRGGQIQGIVPDSQLPQLPITRRQFDQNGDRIGLFFRGIGGNPLNLPRGIITREERDRIANERTRICQQFGGGSPQCRNAADAAVTAQLQFENGRRARGLIP